MRHFRPNFLHGHTEWAKCRKLTMGIFLFQFHSTVMVAFCSTICYNAEISNEMRPRFYVLVYRMFDDLLPFESVNCMHCWLHIAVPQAILTQKKLFFPLSWFGTWKKLVNTHCFYCSLYKVYLVAYDVFSVSSILCCCVTPHLRSNANAIHIRAPHWRFARAPNCLLYTSDAADE